MKKPNKTSPNWTLNFQRGESLTDVRLASVLDGIASLVAVIPKNNWLMLSVNEGSALVSVRIFG